MANISREDDQRDFEERAKNNGNRPHVCEDIRETNQQRIERLHAEVRAGLRQLREMARNSK